MTTYASWFSFSPWLVLSLFLSGCLVHVDDGDEGTLTVLWTLDDTDDPDACLDYDARSIEIVIYDWYGDRVADPLVRCEDFGVSIDLPDGEYALDATLLDRSGRSVTTTLRLDGIDVYEDDEETIDIDFPVDSIR